MNLPISYSKQDLRKAYYRMALKYHPDKLDDDIINKNERFVEISDAYQHLLANASFSIDKDYATSTENDRISMMQKFIDIIMDVKITRGIMSKIIDIAKCGCKETLNHILKELDTDTILFILRLATQYKDVISFQHTILQEIINEAKVRNNKTYRYTLEPDIQHLLNQEFFILQHSGTTLHVPLWCPESVYNVDGTDIIVTCTPKLPYYVDIDEHDNVHVRVELTHDQIRKMHIKIPLGNETYEIPTQTLKNACTNTHTHTIQNAGIPKTCDNRSLLETIKSDIKIHLIKKF